MNSNWLRPGMIRVRSCCASIQQRVVLGPFLDVILCQLEFGGNEKIPEGHGLPRFTPSRSTIVEDSTIKNDPKRTSMNDHQIIILCAFSRLLIAIGTDMWD